MCAALRGRRVSPGAEPAPLVRKRPSGVLGALCRFRERHEGNLGDATDLDDGGVFTEFSLITNPATRSGLSVESSHSATPPMASGYSSCKRMANSRRTAKEDSTQSRGTLSAVSSGVWLAANVSWSSAPMPG